MANIEERLAALEERNQRVEADKAWETSWERRGLILLLTYIVISIFLTLIHIDRPWLNAIVPSIGFLLSTLTISWRKKAWQQKKEN